MNLIIGDSHILALQKFNNEKNEIHQFSASSIRGLLNRKSKSKAGGKIISLLKRKKFDKLFIMFGKVDLEWVFPHKLVNLKIDFNNFIKETIDKYLVFINKIASNFKNIYVMGLHLPSLEENDMLNCINNYRSMKNVSIKAGELINKNLITNIGTLQKRTEQIIYFNDILKEKIENSTNFNYIDITDELLNNENKICKNIFIAPKDHHLKRDETGIIWYNKHLKNLF